MILNTEGLSQTITKELLLTMIKHKQIPICNNFQFSNQVIAMYNISTTANATIVIDQKQGMLMTSQTTRQLLNDFSHQNIFDFQQSRIMVQNSGHPHFLPLVLGRAVYLPLAGISHGSADWVGLHWQQDCVQDRSQELACFTTVNDFILQFHYTAYRNLEDAVHRSSYYSEYLCRILQLIVHSAGSEVQGYPALGIMRQFSTCQCSLHTKLPQTNQEVRQFLQLFQDWTLQRIYNFPELELPARLQAETMQIWRYELENMHSLW
ncbi:hypothetical protein DS831_01325 [Bombilactobacillus bombi]|uniref:Uncharacterized protein n=1 Tax=Bombilactobacillus bombi TaxID=1303590 RepID=A0A417ZJ42_9LACO|nr:hypothetical protein [Bombilactobacillus bombi]RHW52000.1 hypothetical protein DS831_01325 [Bombilactobacillus bombi]